MKRFALLNTAGYDPTGGGIWAKKAKEQDSVYNYFSTHPANDERAKANAVTASKLSEHYVAADKSRCRNTAVCKTFYCHSIKTNSKAVKVVDTSHS